MTRHCVVCGRRLRTGIKYCYKHKDYGQRKARRNVGGGFIWFAIIVGVFYIMGVVISKGKFVIPILILSVIFTAFLLFKLGSWKIKKNKKEEDKEIADLWKEEERKKAFENNLKFLNDEERFRAEYKEEMRRKKMEEEND